MRLLHILSFSLLLIHGAFWVLFGEGTLTLHMTFFWGVIATTPEDSELNEFFPFFNSEFKAFLRLGFKIAALFIITFVGVKAFGAPCNKIANMVVSKAQPSTRHMKVLASCVGIDSEDRNELTEEIEVMLNAYSKLESIGSRTVCAGDLDKDCFDTYTSLLHSVDMRVLRMQRKRNTLPTTTTTKAKAEAFTPSDNYEADIILLKGVKLISEGSEADLEKQWQEWKRIELRASICYSCGTNDSKQFHRERSVMLKEIVKKAFNIYWSARQNDEAKAKKAKAKVKDSHEELMKEMREVEKESKALNEAFKTLDSIKL